MNFETVSIVGLGYIGLPTAAMFASHGKIVKGVDVNKNAVDAINRGEVHIVEPGLEDLVRDSVGKGQLSAAAEPTASDAYIIAVPTPFVEGENSGALPEPDTSFIEAACQSVAPVLRSKTLIILESTSPVGTTEKVRDWLAALRPDLIFANPESQDVDVHIAYCPERILPGNALSELVNNDRVIGGITPACSRLAADLYKTFVRADCLETNARTAEMVKLTENASRDVAIAFANELSIICDTLEINVRELIALANRHPRVEILQPGAGVGGHCIAVDPWFIVSKSPELAKIIRLARETNDAKPDYIISRFQEVKRRHPSAAKVACLGISFKPDIDDTRESPALRIVEQLALDSNLKLDVVEPNLQELPVQLGSNSNCRLIGLERALAECDIVLVLVAHQEFLNLKNMIRKEQSVLDAVGLMDSGSNE